MVDGRDPSLDLRYRRRIARSMEVHPLGDTSLRSDSGSDDPGSDPGRVAVRPGPPKLVVDECRGLDAQRLLGRDGGLLVAPLSVRPSESRNALILDDVDQDG
jgi:hypothetical protein